MKAWEFTRYYYGVSSMHPKNVVVANQHAFQRLTDQQKRAVRDAAMRAEHRGWEMSQERERAFTSTLASNGIQVVSPDRTLLNELQRIGNDLRAEWMTAAGQDARDIVGAYLVQ